MPVEHPLECLHEERWGVIKGALERIETKLDDQHKRIWVGNGAPALNATLQKHDQILSALVWVVGATATAAIGLAIKVLFKA